MPRAGAPRAPRPSAKRTTKPSAKSRAACPSAKRTTRPVAKSRPTKPSAKKSGIKPSAKKSGIKPSAKKSVIKPSAKRSATRSSSKRARSRLVRVRSHAGRGDGLPASAKQKRRPTLEVKAEHLRQAQTVGSFTATGGSCPRARLLTSDSGAFHPLAYPIDGRVAWYNTISGMFCFSQYNHWFIANDYREGCPIFAQNPNRGKAKHPLDIKSPWYFLSAKPDETFKLVKKPMKNFCVIDKDPSMRPVFFDKKSGSIKNMRAFEYSEDECSSGSEAYFKEEAYIKTKYQYARAMRAEALAKLRRDRAKSKAAKRRRDSTQKTPGAAKLKDENASNTGVDMDATKTDRHAS
eukprot:GEMP01052607.1.p1 GENE.GEMP01052607.1~~GEMP01052607.1.p1  ORF type:complete len:349 (+),score=78.39 GEMP01052607.1:147-1193(+)